MKVLLKRISSPSLRTEEVTGIAASLPTPGYPFMMVADSLSADPSLRDLCFRLITTSAVREVRCSDEIYAFTTVSGSQYSLTVLSEDSGPTAIDLLAPTAQA